jgi:hypothetical protein
LSVCAIFLIISKCFWTTVAPLRAASVKLGVIRHHLLPELLHAIARPLLSSQLSQLNFRYPAPESSNDEVLVSGARRCG